MASLYNLIPDIPPAMFESHLNILTSMNGQTDMLWRSNNEFHRDPEYFEVEILRDKKEETDLPLEKSMVDILNMNKYTCHICNIQVPKTYMKEHSNSVKHITSKEIANIALERSKLQMQLEIAIPRRVEISDTYFCEPCATVNLNSDKEKHESTKSHKTSLKHDELLNDLLKIYSDINNVEVKSEVDELELLRQQIELESLEESGSQNAGSDSYENAGTETSEVNAMQGEALSVMKTELKSAFDSETQSVANEVPKCENNMKTENNEVRDLNIPVKNRKTLRGKRFLIKKKGENLHAPALVEIDAGLSTENAVATSEKSAKETSASANNNDYNVLGRKIDEIMAKYFDSNCTVDALNNNVDKEQNKNKLPNKNRKDSHKHKLDKDQSEDTENSDRNEVNKEITQNIENKEQNQKADQSETNAEQIEGDIEQNNNQNTEQNKNKVIKELNKINKNTEQLNKNAINKQNNVTKSNKPLAPSYNLLNYIRDISRRCQTKPIHTVEAVTDKIVQITAINGDKIKILVNNFHSFHVKASDIYCKICECPNVRRPEWHIIEINHRSKVMTPINDQNGIRQLDDIWSHCILCNDMTNNLEFHLQSLLHKNKLKHCLVELGQNKTDSDNDQSDVPEMKHAKKETSYKKGPIITDLILKNNLAFTSKNYLNCTICDVIVDYEIGSIQQHINSFDHLNNFELEQIENKLVDIDSDKFYCIGCDVNFTKMEIVSHCTGKRHKKLLQELLDKQGEVFKAKTDDNEIVLTSISQNVRKQSKGQIDDSELICFVCNVIIYSTDEHMDSFEHKKSYYLYLEANKLNEIEADTFYCIPCNTVLTIDYLMSHCTGRKHKVTLKKFIGNKTEGDEEVVRTGKDINENNSLTSKPSTSSQIPRIVSTMNNVIDKSMRLKVLYQFREMTDSRKLLCTVCDEEIPNNRKVAEYHISTLDHVVAFNLMMLWNKIKKRDDKYFCDICRSDMTYFSEITHVLGKQHASNLARQPKGTVYEYDRTLLTHAYAMSHKVGDRTRLSAIVSVAKPK